MMSFGMRRLARKVLREFHRDALILVSCTYAPDLVTIKLSESDYSKLEPIIPAIREQFSRLLFESVQKRGYRLCRDNITVDVKADTEMESGKVRCECAFGEVGVKESREPDGTVNRFALPTTVRKQGQPPKASGNTFHEGYFAMIPVGGETITLGREGCDVVLRGRSTRVSRAHASISRKDGVVYLEDLGSTNGTFVNGRKVEHCIIRDGDEITIGDYALRYSLRDEALHIREMAP